MRHDALRLNPVPQTAALPRTHREVRVLSPQQCGQIRHAIAQWRTGTVMGPKPDRQLEQLFDVMLGTGTRIGEALAIRRCDLDLTDAAAVTVTVSGTLIFRCKLGIVRQDHPKQSKHWRIVTVPAFTAAALRQRLAVIGNGPQELVFQSRKGIALSPANVRRQWRAIRATFGTVPELNDLATVVPHVFRKTAADTVDKALDTQAPPHRVSEVPQNGRQQRSRRVSDPPDTGQLRHPQTRQREGMAGQTPPVPPAFHANLVVLAEPGRALVPRADR